MSPPILKPAAPADFDALWPVVGGAHLFPDREAFERTAVRDPWCVRIGPGGSAAVLERWRDHMDILAIRGLWASSRELVGVIEELRDVAGERHFSRILSPLIFAEATGSYRRAGFEPLERLVAYRMTGSAAGALAAQPPDGIRLRRGVEEDLAALDALDRACFEPFWAYGPARLGSALTGDTVLVAESHGEVIGYTLSDVERGSGTLGRIAVSASHRGSGAGLALFAESARGMVRAGARSISLCTQEANAVARALYDRAGMRMLPGKLEFLIGDAVHGEGRP